MIFKGQSKGSKQNYKKLSFHNQYRKSYDPYDSHGEDEECPHCDKHSGGHVSGKHSDCCPRYIDTTQPTERIDDEFDLDMSQNGAPPKRRHIQPLHFLGQVSIGRDGLELDHYGTESDEDLPLLEDETSRILDENQSGAGDSTVARTRAQSSRLSYRHPSNRSIRSKAILDIWFKC